MGLCCLVLVPLPGRSETNMFTHWGSDKPSYLCCAAGASFGLVYLIVLTQRSFDWKALIPNDIHAYMFKSAIGKTIVF